MLEFKLSFDEKDGELGLKLDDRRRTFAPIIFNKPIFRPRPSQGRIGSRTVPSLGFLMGTQKEVGYLLILVDHSCYYDQLFFDFHQKNKFP